MRIIAMAGVACLLLFGKAITAREHVSAESCSQNQESKDRPQITISISGPDFQNSARNRVTPSYPQGVRVSGPVVIEVRTDEGGHVESARVISGHPLLVNSALEAVRQWKWDPTLVRKVPAKVVGLITIVFNPDGSVSVDPVAELIARAQEKRPFDTFRLGESTELLTRLKQAPETPIQVVNKSNPPIEIAGTRLKRVERGPQMTEDDDTTPSTFEPYAMSAAITVRNRTDKKITGALLQFVDSAAYDTFFVYSKARPQTSWLNPRKTDDIIVELISLLTDPSNLTVQVAGVLFEDGEKWGAWDQQFPHAPYPPVSKNMPPVDTRPVPLNRPRPDYTEEGRYAHISGSVRLELLVRTDGTPRVTGILNRLPAGLTARAIRAADEMRFKPAMSSGAAVPYTVAIEVEFNLR